MNNILHFFNLHLTSFDEYKKCQKMMPKKYLKMMRKKYREIVQQNRLFRDILRGLKKNELMLLYSNVERIENLIDEFSSLPNIFVPF
jgi:hypothetical protein